MNETGELIRKGCGWRILFSSYFILFFFKYYFSHSLFFCHLQSDCLISRVCVCVGRGAYISGRRWVGGRVGGRRRLRSVLGRPSGHIQPHGHTWTRRGAARVWMRPHAAPSYWSSAQAPPTSTHQSHRSPIFFALFSPPPRLWTPPNIFLPLFPYLNHPLPLSLGLQRDTSHLLSTPALTKPTRHPTKYNGFITDLLTSFFLKNKFSKKIECKHCYNLFLTIPNLFTEK